MLLVFGKSKYKRRLPLFEYMLTVYNYYRIDTCLESEFYYLLFNFHIIQINIDTY